jgi:hypothetical protein
MQEQLPQFPATVQKTKIDCEFRWSGPAEEPLSKEKPAAKAD